LSKESHVALLDHPPDPALASIATAIAQENDGEDVLTPVVERASEAIAAIVTRGGK
jgi:hypothetical protein